MTRFVRTLDEPPEYGLGLGRLELGGEQVWAHTGDIYGFHADLAYLPDQHVTIAALINFQQPTSWLTPPRCPPTRACPPCRSSPRTRHKPARPPPASSRSHPAIHS